MSNQTSARAAATVALLAATLSIGGSALAQQHARTSQDWADSLRHVSMNGCELAYVDAGGGDPIVLVHGTSADYRAWLGAIGPLARQYRVIAYSRRYHLPNTGGGDGRGYSLALHERDLMALIDTLGLGKVNLVGHSYGATLAARFAADHPERVRSLVLAEPAIPELMKGAKQESLFVADRRFAVERARQALVNDFPDLGLQAMAEWSFGEEAATSMPKAVKQRLADNAAALKLEYLSPVRPAPLGCEQIRRIESPVLYLDGARSPWHARAMADAFVSCRPATQRVTLKNVSHGLVWEDPRGFSKAVLEFLGRNALAGD